MWDSSFHSETPLLHVLPQKKKKDPKFCFQGMRNMCVCMIYMLKTHPWANVTGSGHAVQEVEEECLVSSVETIETVKKGHVVGQNQRHL